MHSLWMWTRPATLVGLSVALALMSLAACSDETLEPTNTPTPPPTATPTPEPTPTSTPTPTATSTCRLEERSAIWNVEGYALDSDGHVGRSIGKAQWRPTFSTDWERGHVFGDREDMLLLDATMAIVVSHPSWVWFEMGGDDGFALFINGKEVLIDWQNGSLRSWGRNLWMQPGLYELRLRYYEWTDRAELFFRTSRDVLEWFEAVGCHEGDRPMLAASSSDAVVFDGALLPGISPRPNVVVLQGIDSESSCEDVGAGWEFLGKQLWSNGRPHRPTTSTFPAPTPEPTPDENGMFMRRQALVGVLQSHLHGDWERSVLGFSYSGSYRNCATGTQVSVDQYPLGDYRVFPEYDSSDTCDGVRNAARRLNSLLQSLHALGPDRETVLIGHSLGGMIAAYYVVEVAPPDVRAKINSIITIDSPLLGYDSRNPFSDCPDIAQSWQDILGESQIVPSVNSIQDTDLAEKFVHLNSTNIGQSLVGGREIHLECGTQSTGDFTILGGLLGTVLTGGWGGLITGAFTGGIYGEYGPGHNCGFYDPVALMGIVGILR